MHLGQKLKSFLRGQVASDRSIRTRLPGRFQSDFDVERYVEQQLTRGLPSEWSYRRGKQRLEWYIEPRVRTDKVAGWVDYTLCVSGDWRFFIFYYGNTDAGARVRFLSNAMVITSEELNHYPFAEAVCYVIQNCELNKWGLT